MIAVVFKTAGVNKMELFSPFTNPLYVTVSAGFATPSFLVILFAVIVKFALSTVKDLDMLVSVYTPSPNCEAMMFVVPAPTICISPVEETVATEVLELE